MSNEAKKSEIERNEENLEKFKAQFLDAEADEKKLIVLSGLVEEAFDCKAEIIELKADIRRMKAEGARFSAIARREKILIQKRASYSNMLGRICKEIRKKEDPNKVTDFYEGLEDYE